MRQQRKFTREFKVEAVRLSRQPGRRVGEVTKSLDEGEGLLQSASRLMRSWKNGWVEPQMESMFNGESLEP